jgi:hypothetical protein
MSTHQANERGLCCLVIKALALYVMVVLSQAITANAEQMGPFVTLNIDANLGRYNPTSQVVPIRCIPFFPASVWSSSDDSPKSAWM